MASKRNGTSRLRGLLRAPGEFCVWVIPPSTGKVRKVRLKSGLVISVCLLAVIGATFLGLMITDYGRLQHLRLKTHFLNRDLSRQRDELQSANKNLEAKLTQLRNQALNAASYERTVRERLAELQSVVGTIRKLGAQRSGEGTTERAQNGVTKGGVGGAEIECEPGMLRCSSLVLSEDDDEETTKRSAARARKSPVSLSAPKRAAAGVEAKDSPLLVSELDKYIEILEHVPLAVPGNGTLSSDFGYRRSPFSSKISLHEGIDISMPTGSRILATGAGIVSAVGYHPTYGLVIDIEHTERISSRYAHLQRSFVRVGQKIERGKVIALAGTSGRSTGPHLHYEVLLDGKPYDPQHLISLGERIAQSL